MKSDGPLLTVPAKRSAMQSEEETNDADYSQSGKHGKSCKRHRGWATTNDHWTERRGSPLVLLTAVYQVGVGITQ